MQDEFSHVTKRRVSELQAWYLTVASSVIISVLLTLAVLWLIINYFPNALALQGVNQAPAPSETSGLSTTTTAATFNAIPDIVAKAKPAVVSVVITADVPVVQQYFDQFNPFGDLFGGGGGFNIQIPQQRQIGTKKQEIGGGTGFFVSPDGYIVTNKHVVDTNGASYSIVTDDGTSYDVDVVAKDPTLDIAILKVKSDKTFPYLEFENQNQPLRLGSSVIAIGNALAQFPNSISVGVISGLSRDIVAGELSGAPESLEGVIQTDAAINPGNSGGPLLDLNGRVIGVNVAVAGGSQNIGFALPENSVQKVYESVRKNGEIVVPFVGVRYIQIDKTLAKQNDLSVDYGVLVARGSTPGELAVIPGSPANKAGIVENDIILEIDGKKLDGTQSFASIIRDYSVGDTITLKVLHNGEEKDVKLTLEKAPNNT